MLIRFTTLAQNAESGHRSGMLVAAHTLRDEGRMSHEEHEMLRLLLGWFNTNLPVPSVLEAIEHRRAISWFKPGANDAIRKMWELKQLLESHGTHVDVLRTTEPGSILYEDAWQVVAKPPKGVRF
ncbi:MAG: hypothetical protein QM776_06090 [Rhodocyclaceae bacterium]